MKESHRRLIGERLNPIESQDALSSSGGPTRVAASMAESVETVEE